MTVTALQPTLPAQRVVGGLTSFSIGTDAADIQASARHIARLSVLDWVAVATAGIGEPVSRIVRDTALADGGAAQAGLFGADICLPARAAALVNGVTSHALDYDDTHFAFFGHPSVSVFPAAFAVAEKIGAKMTEALDAALIGAEVACRVGRWLGQPHYDAGFHQTATSGSFGATAAAGRLLGLDEAGMSHAFGLVSTRAAGLKSQFGTMGKPYHAGMAASNGVEAATLAAAGFVSNPDGMECIQGFSATHSGAEDGEAMEGLGDVFLFEGVQHKFHACCHGTHATLEAIQTLKQKHSLKTDDVESVTVTVDPLFLKVCNLPEPQTGLEAKFSFRLTAAMALSGWNTASLETFSDAACQDPDLVSLRNRVRVETRTDSAPTLAMVTVRTRSGDQVAAEHDIDAPLDPEVRTRKVRAKAETLLGSNAAARIWKKIEAMSGANAPFRLGTLIGDTDLAEEDAS